MVGPHGMMRWPNSSSKKVADKARGPEGTFRDRMPQKESFGYDSPEDSLDLWDEGSGLEDFSR